MTAFPAAAYMSFSYNTVSCKASTHHVVAESASIEIRRTRTGSSFGIVVDKALNKGLLSHATRLTFGKDDTDMLQEDYITVKTKSIESIYKLEASRLATSTTYRGSSQLNRRVTTLQQASPNFATFTTRRA